jgi:glycosyltransferase involved in cell wall biosynthesis
VLRASVRLAGATTRLLYNAVRSAEEHEAIGYPVDRRVVIPNGFDVQQFRPDAAAHAELRREWGWPADAIVVGLVARDHPQKDLPTFFRAAGLAARAHPGLRFVVAGDGLETGNPHLETLAGEAELGDKIRLLGTRRDVTRLFAAFDVATLCSRTEAFPNVLGEAMACGVVPVATDVGDVRALVGETGAVVPVGSASELAAGWIRHTERPAPERRRAGEAARARIVSDFALPRVAERYAGLYREVRPC